MHFMGCLVFYIENGSFVSIMDGVLN
jgi:hypothetical protein